MAKRKRTEQKPELKIKKRSGEIVKFREEKIERAIGKAAASVGKKVALESLRKTVVQRVRRRFEKVVTVEQMQDIIEDVLVKNDLTQVAKAFMLYRKQRQEERDAKAAIIGKVIRTDLSLNAVKLLHDQYLLRDESGSRLETPDQLFERVAAAVAEAEAGWVKQEKDAAIRLWKGRFKRAMMNLDFLPSSSVLMNAGLPDASLTASTALPIHDHLRDVFDTLSDAADVQRHGAGTGFNFSSLRERCASVHDYGAVSGGPLGFLHIYNEGLTIIQQNGRRQGANIALLNVHHPDILDFISAKVKEYRLTNFNISVALTEEFLKSAILDTEYDLLSPMKKEPVARMYAKQVFDIMVASAWNYADPGILFMDRIQRDNPIPDEPIITTSPCAEFMLSAYECGFNGNINLANYVIIEDDEPKIDYKRLRETIFLAVRFLDDMIQINHFPLKRSKHVCTQHRKIGLGVMGFAHLLYQLHISYNSDEGVETAREVAKFLRAVADEASFELAGERGVFPAWKRSIYKREKMRLRNATRLAISPTGSSSMIANTSSSIEPVFALSHRRQIASGQDLSYLDPYLERALRKANILSSELIERIVNHGLQSCEDVPKWIRKVFVTTHDISPEHHVRMQAAWQEFVTNGVSKTVNLPYDATLLDVENVFFLAYKLGCKGVTVYREGSKSNQVLELTTLMQKPTRRETHSVREELKAQFGNKQLTEFTREPEAKNEQAAKKDAGKEEE